MSRRRSWRIRCLRIFRWGILMFILIYLLPVGYQLSRYYFDQDRSVPWWSQRRDSSTQAPDLTTTSDAIIQVYAARAVRWRGTVGVHTWFATRKSDENHYERMEVMGYALRWSNRSVRIHRGIPDQYWFGNRPTLLRELRGGREVDALIDRIRQATGQYPYNDRYSIWPGPNSNTFTAYLGRTVPELSLELPAHAIGKDYPVGDGLIQIPPSGRGFQFTARGLFGLLVAPEEGIEMNILGLTAGIDFSPLALKLPAIGRIGRKDLQREFLP